MTLRIPYQFSILFFLFASCTQRTVKEKNNPTVNDSIVKDPIVKVFLPIPGLADSCTCDSNATKRMVRQKSFNTIAKYDARSFAKEKFYDLDSQTNRALWFRDIENPASTKFTELWDAYWKGNYFAAPRDFLGFYENKSDIPLAFIFGPNDDLWAYHIFVIKQIGCCYLITRSYYRHNRFTYKAFAVFDNKKLKELYAVIHKINLLSLHTKEEYGYKGYFVDNLSKRKFRIDFEKEVIRSTDSSHLNQKVPKQDVADLYDFVDNKLNWIKTYGQ